MVTTRTGLSGGRAFSLFSPGGRGLQKFHKPAAEGGVPHGPLLACVDKLGSRIGKLGAECGDDQLVMGDDRLAICGRFERRVGLDGCAADIRLVTTRRRCSLN